MHVDTFLPILSLVITNLVTIVELPMQPCNDWAIVACHMSGIDSDSRTMVKLETLDVKGTIIGSSWVSESYVPPSWEQVLIQLPNDVASVRCEIVGSPVILRDGKFTIFALRPKLSIKIEGPDVVLSSENSCGEWRLERKIDDGIWQPSPWKVPIIGGSSMFRLNREIVYKCGRTQNVF